MRFLRTPKDPSNQDLTFMYGSLYYNSLGSRSEQGRPEGPILRVYLKGNIATQDLIGKDFAILNPPQKKTSCNPELDNKLDVRLIIEIILGGIVVVIGTGALAFLAYYFYFLFWKKPW